MKEINCRYYDSVRNACGSGDREDWNCEGEGCPVQKTLDNGDVDR